VVAFPMSYTNDLCPYILGALCKRRGSRQGSARNFKRNLCCWPKGAMDSNQRASSGDVQRGSKFQEVFAALVSTPYENRNGERQPHPLATLYARLALIQACAPI
jgi:hypothetical protein